MITLPTDFGVLVAVTFAPGDDSILGVSKSGHLIRWANEEPEVTNLRESAVSGLALTPRSGKVFFTSKSGLHEVGNRKPLVEIPTESTRSIAVCLSEEHAVFGYTPEAFSRAPRTLFWVDLVRKKSQAVEPVEMNPITALAGIPNTRTFAWGNWERQLHIRDLTRSPRKHHALKNCADAITFNQQGTLLAVGSDWEVMVFEVESFPSPPKLLGRHQGMVQSVAFVPGGRLLVTGGSDKTVRIWDLQTQQMVANYNWNIGRIESVAVDADGMRGVAVGNEGKFVVWDIDTW